MLVLLIISFLLPHPTMNRNSIGSNNSKYTKQNGHHQSKPEKLHKFAHFEAPLKLGTNSIISGLSNRKVLKKVVDLLYKSIKEDSQSKNIPKTFRKAKAKASATHIRERESDRMEIKTNLNHFSNKRNYDEQKEEESAVSADNFLDNFRISFKPHKPKNEDAEKKKTLSKEIQKIPDQSTKEEEQTTKRVETTTKDEDQTTDFNEDNLIDEFEKEGGNMDTEFTVFTTVRTLLPTVTEEFEETTEQSELITDTMEKAADLPKSFLTTVASMEYVLPMMELTTNQPVQPFGGYSRGEFGQGMGYLPYPPFNQLNQYHNPNQYSPDSCPSCCCSDCDDEPCPPMEPIHYYHGNTYSNPSIVHYDTSWQTDSYAMRPGIPQEYNTHQQPYTPNPAIIENTIPITTTDMTTSFVTLSVSESVESSDRTQGSVSYEIGTKRVRETEDIDYGNEDEDSDDGTDVIEESEVIQLYNLKRNRLNELAEVFQNKRVRTTTQTSDSMIAQNDAIDLPEALESDYSRTIRVIPLRELSPRLKKIVNTRSIKNEKPTGKLHRFWGSYSTKAPSDDRDIVSDFPTQQLRNSEDSEEQQKNTIFRKK